MSDRAVKLAQNILKFYNPESLLSENLLRKICRDYSILIEQHYFKNDKFNGMLWFDKGTYTILVNAELPQSRWIFTLAHEIGHWYMHLGTKKSFFCAMPWGQAYDPVEREANVFAAELLMPRNLVTGFIEAGWNARKIARELRVSEQAANYRVRELNLERKLK